MSFSDQDLNEIYELGKHTLKICRQTIELDSPMHQENLGCIGDYMISAEAMALITVMFGEEHRPISFP